MENASHQHLLNLQKGLIEDIDHVDKDLQILKKKEEKTKELDRQVMDIEHRTKINRGLISDMEKKLASHDSSLEHLHLWEADVRIKLHELETGDDLLGSDKDYGSETEYNLEKQSFIK